jgi:beta-N-acetylhexosaminidase
MVSLVLFLTLAGCNEDEDESVSLDEQIGQMLMIGFRGTTIDEDNTVCSQLESAHVGGVILYDYDELNQSYSRNIESPEQLMQLVADLKLYADDDLLVAIDQEGGYVNRLKTSYGFPESVSAQYLGEMNNSDTTSYYASLMAATLLEMGINVNFAPVVDLNVNPESPAIGSKERSFSADTDTLVGIAEVFVDKHDVQNILTCCKHFPGHGSSTTASYLGMADITDTWSEDELEPYRQMIADSKCRMIMTANVFNLNLDADYPAALSETILTGILRDELNYDGVIVSDAMEISSLTSIYGQKTAIEKAINAGCDILLFPNNTDSYNENIASEAFSLIKTLIEEGSITEERISESYTRIMALKSTL